MAVRLVATFWPGPLTVIVPRAAGIGTAAAGGQATIGLRCPSHPVARALLQAARRAGVPGVAAPSANRFGRLSPTRAEHVAAAPGDGGGTIVHIGTAHDSTDHKSAPADSTSRKGGREGKP